MSSCFILDILAMGSGTGEFVLFIGYFAAVKVSLFRSLRTYGAKVDELKSELGASVDPPAIEMALKAKKYKAITITHVDTSTGEEN
jgi:alanine-glyoxylate transaminase/serine-glyoxylate transaminase/serine-pyruvate transaminase